MSGRPVLSSSVLSPPNVDTFSPDRRRITRPSNLSSSSSSSATVSSPSSSTFSSSSSSSVVRNHLLSPRATPRSSGLSSSSTAGLSPVALAALSSAQRDLTTAATAAASHQHNLQGMFQHNQHTMNGSPSSTRKSTILIDGQEKLIASEIIQVAHAAVEVVHKARDIAKAKEEANKNGGIVDLSSMVAQDIRYVRLENQIKDLERVHEQDMTEILSTKQRIKELEALYETEKNERIRFEAGGKAYELNLAMQEKKTTELSDILNKKEHIINQAQDTIRAFETQVEALDAKLELQKVLTNDALEEKRGAVAAYESLQETSKETRAKDLAKHTAELEKARKDALVAVAAAEAAGDELVKSLQETFDIRIATLTNDLHTSQSSYADAQQEIIRLNDEVHGKIKQLTSKEAEIEELRSELQITKDQSHNFQTELAISQGHHRSVQTELDDANTHIKNLKEDIEELKEEKAFAQTKLRNLQNTMDKEINELEDVINTLRKDLADMTNKYTSEKASEEWASKRAEEARNEARIARQRCEQAVERESNAIKEASIATSKATELQSLLDEERTRVQVLTETVVSITTSNESLKLDIESMKSENNLTIETVNQAYQELQEEFTIVSQDRDRYLERLGSSNISIRAAEEKVLLTQSEMDDKIQKMENDAKQKIETAENNARETIRQMQSLTTIRIKEVQNQMKEQQQQISDLENDKKTYQEKLSRRTKDLEQSNEKFLSNENKFGKQIEELKEQIKKQVTMIAELESTIHSYKNNASSTGMNTVGGVLQPPPVVAVPLMPLPPPLTVQPSFPLPPPSVTK